MKTVKIKSALTIKSGNTVARFSEPLQRSEIDVAIRGIATSATEPIMTPPRVLTPERTAPVAIKKERASGNELGATLFMVIASNAPARPAIPALTVKARTFERPIVIPESSAATSLLLSARQPRP